MRFMHIADVHLGADPEAGEFSQIHRGEEIYATFSETLREAERQDIPLLLIAGDLFHRQPLVRELREVNYLLTEVYHGHTVIIAGNHDYLKSDSNYRSFSWGERVHFLIGSDSAGELDMAELPEYNCEVYGVSYSKRENREPIYRTAKPRENGRIHILLAHGGDEKHIPIRPVELMESPFDYIALGHIHRGETVIPNKAVYAGSLEPTDRNDLGEHGYVVGEIERNDDLREGSIDSETGKQSHKIETRRGKRLAGANEASGYTVETRFVPCAKRRYFQETLEVVSEDTLGSIEAAMQERMEQKGMEHMYSWTLTGMTHPELRIDSGKLRRSGNVLEIRDQTIPSYDLNALLAAHQGDVIGRYIESYAGRSTDMSNLPGIEREALYMGLRAMLEEANMRG